MMYDVIANRVSTALLQTIRRLYTRRSFVLQRHMPRSSSEFKARLKHTARVSEIRNKGLAHAAIMPAASLDDRVESNKDVQGNGQIHKACGCEGSSCEKNP